MTRESVKRWARIFAGSALLVLGFVGLFLPFLQGVLFIVVGLALVSPESERIRRLEEWVRSRWLTRREQKSEREQSTHDGR